jgi:hypothetical protein
MIAGSNEAKFNFARLLNFELIDFSGVTQVQNDQGIRNTYVDRERLANVNGLVGHNEGLGNPRATKKPTNCYDAQQHALPHR